MSVPKPTFKYCSESGTGSIGNLEAFRTLDGIYRLDMLSDWIDALREEYMRTPLLGKGVGVYADESDTAFNWENLE